MKQRWKDLGERFEALGWLVRERKSAETAPTAEPHDGSDVRAALREAFEKIVTAAQELDERAAATVRDPAVKKQTALVTR